MEGRWRREGDRSGGRFEEDGGARREREGATVNTDEVEDFPT